ncbi:LTA synthase family protein [Halomonas piscis]|uniref:LTA synthase family protein n=1 Tax=Halomonas piscis TaxID=3031727 RepID=UPI0028A0A3BD|nr:LTA synthase family protein [Halomonas piscis]
MNSLPLGPLLMGLVASLGLEALLAPRPRPFWRRGVAAGAVHLGSWCLLWGIAFLLLQRPWFATVTLLSLQLVVVQSSNTKTRTLNEPFICQDFEYFIDAVRHPRLYVPFFGIALAAGASLAGLVTIAAFFLLEGSSLYAAGLTTFLATGVALCALGAALVAAGVARLPGLTLCPGRDLEALGLFASLWAYGVALLRRAPPPAEASPFAAVNKPPSPQLPAAERPHVVLVQNESFSDPRSWCSDVAQGVLSHWDDTRPRALQHGLLGVPAWGANTVRTECAVLTGLAPADWGIHQFNPYRSLSRRAFPSLAAAFREAGYRTVCLHPYPARFYSRHRVMPHLGFDTFIDDQAFSAADKNGQYIGDAAVARKVSQLLAEPDERPLFIFVITMENHGPLGLEPPRHDLLADTLPGAGWPLPEHQRHLAVYLRHLREADAMLGALKRALGQAPRPGLLGFYGDHVPILPEAYAYYSRPAGESPYMIWSTRQTSAIDAAPTRLAAHELGRALLRHAGAG